jgi:hypothetical protein
MDGFAPTWFGKLYHHHSLKGTMDFFMPVQLFMSTLTFHSTDVVCLIIYNGAIKDVVSISFRVYKQIVQPRESEPLWPRGKTESSDNIDHAQATPTIFNMHVKTYIISQTY